MLNELRLSLGVSVGVHAAALIGWPALRSPVVFDVERAPTSVEIVLVAPQPTAEAAPVVRAEELPPTPDPEPSPEPAPEAPPTQTVVVPEQRGALTEMLPSYLKNPPPRYPLRARREGYEGTVLLDVEVLPSGRCGRLRTAHSSGYAILDEAALAAVAAWRFQPATRGRQPVAVGVEIPVTFRLIDRP
jgi:protein TonB